MQSRPGCELSCEILQDLDRGSELEQEEQNAAVGERGWGGGGSQLSREARVRRPRNGVSDELLRRPTAE